MKPLEGYLVLDFSQFLAGPSAALRLSDFGARVIKIERPKGGDGSRNMFLKNLESQGDSVLFQTINRGKESFTADLKSEEGLNQVKEIISKADVMIENFRPGIMKRLGLGYEDVLKINPGIVYATVTGYGSLGPWLKKPGQDLLVQSLSGATWLNGDSDDIPTPFALSLADSYAGVHLAEGIMACLLRKCQTGKGGLVEVSLMESMLDMQFEMITTYLNDGQKEPFRCKQNSANIYLGAPYGIYECTDGYIALAMGSIKTLGEVLEIALLIDYSEDSYFECRDEIKKIISDKLKHNSVDHWLSLLEPAGYWCSKVMDWNELTSHEGFVQLNTVQNVGRKGSEGLFTTSCPIRIDEESPKNEVPAPRLGEQTEAIKNEFQLGKELDK